MDSKEGRTVVANFLDNFQFTAEMPCDTPSFPQLLGFLSIRQHQINKKSSPKNVTLLPPWKGQGHALPGSILIIWGKQVDKRTCVSWWKNLLLLNQLALPWKHCFPQCCPSCQNRHSQLPEVQLPSALISLWWKAPCVAIPLSPHLLLLSGYWKRVNVY